MNIQNLRYLLEIAQQGSVTSAAKVLYLSQPRLSKNTVWSFSNGRTTALRPRRGDKNF